jgi:hypothetical protein
VGKGKISSPALSAILANSGRPLAHWHHERVITPAAPFCPAVASFFAGPSGLRTILQKGETLVSFSPTNQIFHWQH